MLVAYAALSLLLTWPLVLHLGTHVPGDGIDDPSLAWNLWWVKHGLVDQPQNPFACNWQFWPVGINLAFYTLTILNGLLGLPVQAVVGVTPAYNVLLLSSFALGGYGAYLLCRDFVGQTRSRLGPFLGGALYAFASAKLFYAALGQGNIASSQWIPFCVLYMLRVVRPSGRVRDVGLAALFMVLQAYAELTYASFLAVFAALLVVWVLVRSVRESSLSRARDTAPGPLLRMLLVALLFGCGIVPILANMIPDLAAEGDFFTSGGGFAEIFSADVAGYALPTQLHPLLGESVRKLTDDSTAAGDGRFWPIDKGQHLYLGYTASFLVLLGLWRSRRRSEAWLWAGAGLAFFLLTLGPSLRFAGRDLHIPLPFELMAQLPFFKGNRYPSRYSVMLLISIAPLLAAAVQSSHRARYMLLAGLMLFEHLSVPLPLSDLRVPELYQRVASTPGDFAVLELPLGWRNGARVAGKSDIVIMQQLWYQTQHGKRLLGGNTSRNPEFKFQYFSEDPTLARLIALTNAADLSQHTALRTALAASPVSEDNRVQARKWAAFLRLRYVMVHRDKLPPETEADLQALLPVTLIAEDGALALYELPPDLSMPREFALAAEDGRMALAEGWNPLTPDPSPTRGEGSWREGGGETGLYAAAFAERAEARLLLPLPDTSTALRFYGWSVAPDQSVTLVVDGRTIGTLALPQQAAWLAFEVGADPDRPPLSDVRLHFSRLASISQAAGKGPWAVGATGANSPVSILSRSAGQETGDFAHLYVNGRDVSPNQRGYNLVALDPANGKLRGAVAFDTHGGLTASRQMAEWIAGLPPGTIVAGAIRDEGSMNLSEDAIAALQSLGAASDLRGHFRWGHAFIGVAGARAGTALESMEGILPAQVSLGLPASAPQVAAGMVRVVVGD